MKYLKFSLIALMANPPIAITPNAITPMSPFGFSCPVRITSFVVFAVSK